MKKNKFNYSDFSKKELEYIKEFYINEKISSMNESELRKFVYENISIQVKNTIGDEEEQEAWEEIENFFSDNFEQILIGIKNKFEEADQSWDSEQKKNLSTVQEEGKRIDNDKKIDMWID